MYDGMIDFKEGQLLVFSIMRMLMSSARERENVFYLRPIGSKR